MKIKALILIAFIFFFNPADAQTNGARVLKDLNTLKTYLFYLHGQITIQNGKGMSPYWGVYEYQQILDTLASYGYNVISEPRPEDTQELAYANKVARQIDTLLNAGVDPVKFV